MASMVIKQSEERLENTVIQAIAMHIRRRPTFSDNRSYILAGRCETASVTPNTAINYTMTSAMCTDGNARDPKHDGYPVYRDVSSSSL